MQSNEPPQQSHASSNPYSPPWELPSNTAAQSDGNAAPRFHSRVRIVWAVLCGVSIAVLFLYRSASGHGPDLVGKEMTAFLSPLVLAFFVSVVYLLATTVDGHSRGKLVQSCEFLLFRAYLPGPTLTTIRDRTRSGRFCGGFLTFGLSCCIKPQFECSSDSCSGVPATPDSHIRIVPR